MKRSLYSSRGAWISFLCFWKEVPFEILPVILQDGLPASLCVGSIILASCKLVRRAAFLYDPRNKHGRMAVR